MATSNSSKQVSSLPTASVRDGMLDHVKTIRQSIKEGATGFLFAAVMPDGELNWFAAGDLDRYDAATYRAAIQLKQCAIHFALSGHAAQGSH